MSAKSNLAVVSGLGSSRPVACLAAAFMVSVLTVSVLMVPTAASAGALASVPGRADATPTWSPVPVPSRSITDGGLSADSCSSRSACTAVGSYHDLRGVVVPLAESWDGNAWTIQAAAKPAGATASALGAVSCSSATACVAVGSYASSSKASQTLAEAWDGTRWRIQATANPAGSAFLLGVSCRSATACLAVGYSTPMPGTSDQMLAEAWDGTAWTIQAAANPAGATASMLNAVSCTAARTCTAVGLFTNASGTDVTLAEAWDGTAWTIQSTANPPRATFSELSGVSCTAASACTAVGNTASQSASSSLAETWDGTAWTIQPTPNPAGGANSSLVAVSCASARACNAVGFSPDGAILAEHWDGTSWTISVTPSPPGRPTSFLNAVSCATATTCIAVGNFNSSAVNLETLAEIWNGTAWTIQTTANAIGATDNALIAVSCTSATACTSVGYYTNRSGTTRPLAERWDGSAWTFQDVANPAGDMALNAVSCSTATTCIAVGTDNASGTITPVAEAWDGTAWTRQNTPQPAGAASSSLAGVSCVSASDCTAVGDSAAPSGADSPLVERWDGSAWTIQPTPNPGGASSALNAVSCPTTGACTAVGLKFVSGGSTTLAETWDGAAWTIQAAPNPGTDNSLDAVSCSAAAACTALGSTQTPARTTFTARWDGATWTIQTTPNPVGATSSFLSGVSCVTATACTVVGHYPNPSNPHAAAPLAETWDGTAWTIQSTDTSKNSTLNAVSCATATTCTAVGTYDLRGVSQAFVEHN